MELITIKNFVEKHSVEEAFLRAVITALQLKFLKKDDSVKKQGVKPGLYDEAVLLKALEHMKTFTV